MKLKSAPLCLSLGDTPTLQLLSFLIAHQNFDYSKTEFSNNIEMTRQTIYKALEPLLKYKMVIKSRKIGNTTLYKLNIKSEPVKAIQYFNNTIVKMIIEEEGNKDIDKEDDISYVLEHFEMGRD